MKKLMVAAAAISIFGCAAYRPIVDMRNVNKYQYEYDLKECQAYAKQISPSTNAVVGLGVGGVIGGGLGAIVGAFFGCAGDGAALGAALGGAQGAAGGAAGGVVAQKTIINNCMMGRGYNVLY